MPSDTEEWIQKPKPSVPHLAPSMDVDNEDLDNSDAEGMALLPPAYPQTALTYGRYGH